ncbi:geranylgeranyl reductase family protein [Marivirga arenosa]|uniref:Geranylgeranyl reductase family protein n=1 Tax=Marivirga arenosa TaxID=3059076 RepID=A0AA49GCU8_9BACT|nr:geranylgeranyl reductase family protein [Marivirga sp. BKB1-2]WKK80596.2 geranylgeranyl reductase family protein [Marivirga sp. BKB1-2]
MANHHFDLIIVGAGPAGCTCAYQLRHTKLRIAVIDKATFPRDKICGDALSADVVNQLDRMDPTLVDSFKKFNQKLPSQGVSFFAPNGQKLDIPFTNPNFDEAAGYISKRVDFDQFMFDQIKDQANVELFVNEKIEKIEYESDLVKLESKLHTFTSKLIIGADGAYSVVNKYLGNIKVEKEHYCAGLRQYYKNVNGFNDQNHIELHFYKELLPGYFWVFPLPNGQANVGLGMLSSEVSKRQLNLKSILYDLIHNHPNLKDRFKNAEPIEDIKGFGLPIGSKKRAISGRQFLLLGDAASLIDPFTGEGIGNAIRSGRIAAEVVEEAFYKNYFDSKYLHKYDQIIEHKMRNELRISRSMQKLLKYPKLFNFVVKKANSNSSVRTLLTSMLDNVDLKKELIKPRFYIQLLFGSLK